MGYSLLHHRPLTLHIGANKYNQSQHTQIYKRNTKRDTYQILAARENSSVSTKKQLTQIITADLTLLNKISIHTKRNTARLSSRI